MNDLQERLYAEIMDLSEVERLEFMADMSQVMYRVNCSMALVATSVERSKKSPALDTATVKKRAVSMASKKQLAADLRYCQTEGVDVAAFIKAKYKVA